MAGSGAHGSEGVAAAAAAAAPEDQAYPLHREGSAWQAARAGLGSTAGPEVPEAGAAPARRAAGEAGGPPTLCLRAGPLPPKKELNRTVCPWPVVLSQAIRRAFSWVSAVYGANTGMHTLLYVLCFLFLDTFDFFT